MLRLTTSFLWAVEGAGWIPYSDSDAEMQRGQEGGAESTDPPAPVLCIGRPQQASQRWKSGVVGTL